MRTYQNVTENFQPTHSIPPYRRAVLRMLVLFSFMALSMVSMAQLGTYNFTGSGSCPNQNPNVTTQPANAIFSSFTTANASCKSEDNINNSEDWNTSGTIATNEYHQFSITANASYGLQLTTLSFTQYVKDDEPGCAWILRSSRDNFAANVATGSATTSSATPTINLPVASFSNIGAVTFRLYLINSRDNSNEWTIDNVTLSGTVEAAPADPSNPTSDSPQCSVPGVTLTATGSAPAGETWYWQTSPSGTSIANSGATYVVNISGTYYIRSQDNTTLVWSNGVGSVVATVTPNVGTPVFTLGASSSRCQGAGTVTYAATATNNTGITYSLDATSIANGETINPSTGAVTYGAGWTGPTVITATAAGCNGPQASTHTVTASPDVATPVFSAGASSFRCSGASTIVYTATASGSTGITYSIDGLSALGGCSINATTGSVNFALLWVGTTTVTATATGCGGPTSATHTVTIAPAVGVPAFTLGASSSRCQGAGTVTYTANATNTSGITYSLDATSLAAGLTINSATGVVTYTAAWSGVATITASAAGCAGPRTATHTATTNLPVTTPVFTLGATTTRCQGANSVTYTASASNTTGITYTLDAATIAGGSTINASTGAVTYAAGWSGTTVITASAAGCAGPLTATHTLTITPTVGTPIFALGGTSSRCFGAGVVNYTASSTNSTGLTYSLDAASIAGGNSINASTGDVTYAAGWSGTTVVTASATGCNGPRTGTHTVTVTPTVGTPVFTLGASSTRCQGNNNVSYSATATNSTSIVYTLDAASLAGGNTINAGNGMVNYVPGWSGTSTITATANGCGTPTTASHVVTITATVGTPVFTLGATTTRCQGAGSVTYSASATTTTGITYSLNAPAIAGGNTINATTGAVTYAAGWTGVTTITASAAGCNGPITSNHSVTITPTVGLPSFVLGSTSTRCQGANTVAYTANSTNNTGITYSLDAPSLAAGNTIDVSTGAVTYVASWTSTSTITASATGCNGPRSSTHTVTNNPSIATPVFTLGATTTRCQGAGSVTYTATATNATGITYTLDAASIAGGNTIVAGTGAVTYAAGWSGTTTVTATAAGCNGPTNANHTVTITPTVGTPAFTLGATSTRCHGAGSVTYSAASTNSTGMSYSLDAASIAGGNSIVAATGAVTYAAGWSGTSTITASATGCNGPRTATHTVTIAANVGVPIFVMGPVSTRLQGAGTVTYSATATSTTGITYSLDAASIAGGNSINAATGAVTYSGGWSGTTIITATAAGCNGPTTSTHTVTINFTSVIKQLYLSDPAQSLDRVDPVNTADATTANTAILSTVGTATTSFTMNPALCDSLVIKAGTITVRTYITVSTGIMPINPTITAYLHYGGTAIITLNNPTYNVATNLLTWTGTLPADMTIPAGSAISLQITTTLAGVNFRIDFDSQTKPSRIDLPVSTFIDITSLDVYSAAYPGGIIVTNGIAGTTKYIRATVTDPFGSSDITGMNIKITPTGATVVAPSVATNGCTRTYEYVWATPVTNATYNISATAREGYENSVTNTEDINYSNCSVCGPVAVNDTKAGAGGTPIIIDVLANDYDPNNNINNSSLGISVQPKNGTAYISNNTVVYLPNGSFQGNDTLTYQICDLTSPVPLCATAKVFLTIDPFTIDICADASKTHTYYIPYPENQSFAALFASTNIAMPSNNIRTIISIKVPYAGIKIVWDEWEDGYEANTANPVQATTKVWGDGNPFNGVAPGYGSDIFPPGASVILDNTMPANPRNSANFFYDGRDKIVSSGQIAVTQVSGEPLLMPVQAIKTNVTSTFDFGQSFTIPIGQDFNSQDFRYTALFIRAAQNNTAVSIDRDNNGTFETTTVLNEGASYLLNGGVMTGATVASDKPIGVELSAGGVDQFSIRNAPIFPATWYSNIYYTPVPTSDVAANNPKDTSVVMMYNSLNRPINVTWYSGAPATGVIAIPAKSAVRFPLAYSATATYKFVNLTGESFTAIEIVDSYTPGGGGNPGPEYDWAFNLISEPRLTDFATVAWAPGSLDGSRNDNPIWVTPTANTTVYVKYDGDVSNGPLTSPCGLKYDVAMPVNALNYIKIRDASDNDQSGTAVYTCNGAKIAAVYGEDPSTAVIANPSWDVGATIQPFCKQKIIIATDDYATSLVSQPVTISVLDNDFGFLATVDPSTVTTLGLLQASNGIVTINDNGTILYEPTPGFSGVDTFEYNVCSTPSPIVCDVARVVITISTCPSNGNQNVISGQVYIDRNKDANNNDGGSGLPGVKVYLYTDGNCSGTINANELTDSVTVDSSGFYQFTKYPEKIVEDNFDGVGGVRTCANGTDGDSPWATNWVDANDLSVGFCNTSQTPANTDVEIMRDGAFGFGLRLKGANVSASRSVNVSGSLKAFLTFSYRRKSATLTTGKNILVQASSNGSTFTTIHTISGNGTADANYRTVFNQDISAYASTTTTIRFLTNGSVGDADTVYIDNVTIRYLKYPQCYVTSIAGTSVPANYALTTVGTKTISITSGGTCSSQFDFGLAKPNVTISGTLYNDKNGLIDAVVNGPAVGQPGGVTMYAYLVDVAGDVVLKATVNSTNGTYSFPLAEVFTDYTLILSATNVSLGAIPPAALNCPAIWYSVGESYGTNNAIGTGNEAGIPNGRVAIRTTNLNVPNVNVGIQRVPNSDNYYRSIGQPSVNQSITLNGGANPPILSGTDPEDCVTTCALTAQSVIIDTVPNNAELYYNNILVTNGQLITNFNPALFQMRITAASLGDTSIIFNYSFVDEATMKDPTPAIYALAWLVPLPADRLVATASLSGSVATIKWTTNSEQNTSFYTVERSIDNNAFTATGNRVAAAGNSDDKREYQMPDNISSLMQHPVIYYRVKLNDLDGKVSYSNTVVVRLSKKPGVTVWPNPFTSHITISITTERETSLEVKLIDVSGRTIQTMTQSASRGISQVTIRDLEKLPSGVYLVEITDKKAGTTFQKLLKNNQ
ncbi:MAG: T9SS type A sorting domain-containing protein [Chitinophagaceae bacterium]|nr:T9SS type A sorting domain-containing protein [Chitinophagaceae bacterium]